MRYVTSQLFTQSRRAQMPLNLTHKFKNKTFDENGLEIEVKVNGKKQSLKYKL